MTPKQMTNFIDSVESFRKFYHEDFDRLCDQLIGIVTNYGHPCIEQVDIKVPLNNLKPDPARSSVTRRQAIKLKTYPICGRELPLGQFRSSDNHLHDECNACREERYYEIKKGKRKNKKAS